MTDPVVAAVAADVSKTVTAPVASVEKSLAGNVAATKADVAATKNFVSAHKVFLSVALGLVVLAGVALYATL